MASVQEPETNASEATAPSAPVTEAVEPTPTPENKSSAEEDGNEEGVECGFLVDRISTMPYQKAIDRGEVPFCAFAPISTKDLYLLRIQECADKTRHMLVPASKEDVFSTPGALKTMEDDQEPGNEESMNYRVAIVAIARQIYSDEDKQLVVSVDQLLKIDKKRIQVVKFLTLDKFADFAFLGFDGNVSEFANSNNNNDATGNKESRTASSTSQHNQSQQLPTDAKGGVMSTPAVPISVKSPPKAPARRGRGGRRRMSRKSPSATPKRAKLSTQQKLPQFFSSNFQQLSGVPLAHEMSSEFTQALIKMEQNEGDGQQFMNQSFQYPMSQAHDQSMYTQEAFVIPSDLPMLQVPTPVSEVTISTTEPGADVGAQQVNNDLITIAFDQLVGMSSEVSSTDASASEKSSRGGRRAGPGRKPGRKPLKERHPNQIDVMDDNATFGQLMTSDDMPVAPKRRGRPPKNRVQLQFTGQENENSNSGAGQDVEIKDANYGLLPLSQVM